MKRHAPSLGVLFYEGWSKFTFTHSKATTTRRRRSRAPGDDETPAPEDNSEEWCSYINGYDVCITTYNVLKNDLHTVRLPEKQPRRGGVISGYFEAEESVGDVRVVLGDHG